MKNTSTAQRGGAGLLIEFMILFAIVHGIWPDFPTWPAGLSGWLAGCLLWHRTSFGQRIQVTILITLGAAGMLWGWQRGGTIQLERIIDQNHALLAMLAAVSFLRLVSMLDVNEDEEPPQGWSAYLRTLFGVHLFGSAINLSAVSIIGDRLTQRAPLDRRSAILISRGFSSASIWSPFFAGMAVVLTYVPNAEIPVLMVIGLPLAMCGLAYTFITAFQTDPARLTDFKGYPIQFQSLWVPASLALCVLLTHSFIPSWSILTVISLSAPLLAYVILAWRNNSGDAGMKIKRHIFERLPDMSGELLLFLGAGVLAVGLSSLFSSFEEGLPFDTLNGTSASITLIVLVALAAIGIHPVISISTVATWFTSINPDHTLLAMVFLMTWGIGVAGSPLAGTHLMIQGRFGIESWRFFRWNLDYCIFMLILASVVLHLYSSLT